MRPIPFSPNPSYTYWARLGKKIEISLPKHFNLDLRTFRITLYRGNNVKLRKFST
jgi:hypothetical protein